MDNKVKPAGLKDNQTEDLLKAKLNNFLIEYFNYLAIALGVIILGVGLFFLVYPQYQKAVKDNESASASRQSEFEEKSAYLKKIENLKKAYDQVSSPDRSKVETMVPLPLATDGLMAEFEAIALKNGAILDSVKIAPEEAKTKTSLATDSSAEKKEPAGIFDKLPLGVGRIKIEVDLSSISYPVLKNIIKTIENNLRLMDISKISYQVNENKANLSVYAYYLK